MPQDFGLTPVRRSGNPRLLGTSSGLERLKAELRKRGLGFAAQTPQFGFNPGKIFSEVPREEGSKIVRGVRELARGDTGGFGQIGEGASRFVGRELYEGLIRPGNNFLESGNAAFRNTIAEILAAQQKAGFQGDWSPAETKDQIERLRYGTKVYEATMPDGRVVKFPDTVEAGPIPGEAEDKGERDRSDTMVATMLATAFLPATGKVPLINRSGGLARVAFEAAYPGGMAEATPALAKGLIRAPGAAVRLGKAGVTSGRFAVGKALQETAPDLASRLMKPGFGDATEAVPDWPRIVYKTDSGDVAGLVVERGRLQELINKRRAWDYLQQRRVAAGTADIPEEALQVRMRQTQALEALQKAMSKEQMSHIILREDPSNLYRFADWQGQLMQARQAQLEANLRNTVAQKELGQYEALLGYVEEPVLTGGKPKTLAQHLKKALLGLDPMMQDTLDKAAVMQKDLSELETSLVPAAESRYGAIRGEISQRLEGLRSSMPQGTKANVFPEYVKALDKQNQARAVVDDLERQLGSAQASEGTRLGKRANKRLPKGVTPTVQTPAEGQIADMQASQRELLQLRKQANRLARQADKAKGEEASLEIANKMQVVEARIYELSTKVESAGGLEAQLAAARVGLENADARLAKAEKSLIRALPEGPDLVVQVRALGEESRAIAGLHAEARKIQSEAKAARGQADALRMKLSRHAGAVRSVTPEAHAQVVQAHRDYLFRPADADETMSPLYELRRIELQGNKKEGYRRVAVFYPVAPEAMATRGEEAKRLAQLHQKSEYLKSAEAELVARQADVIAANKALAAARKAGAGVDEARAALTDAKRGRSTAQKSVESTRNQMAELEAAKPSLGEGATLSSRKPLTMSLDDAEQKMVRYKVSTKTTERLGGSGTTGNVQARRLALQKQEIERDLADLQRRRESLTGQLQEANAVRDNPAADPAERELARARALELEPQLKEISVGSKREDELHYQLDQIEDALAATDRERFAKVHAVRQEAAQWEQRLADATADVERYQEQIDSLMMPPPIRTVSRGGKDYAVVPGYASKETVATYRAKLARDTQDYFLRATSEQVSKGKKVMDAKEVDDFAEELKRMYQPLKDLKFTKGMAHLTQRLEAISPRLATTEAFKMMVAQWEHYDKALDVGARRGGFGGFARRVLMGTGFRTTKFEAMTATLFNLESQAAFRVKATYGELYQQMGQAVADVLRADAAEGKAGAAEIVGEARKAKTVAGKLPSFVAHNLLRMRDHERLVSAYLQRGAKPIDSPAWRSIWNTYEALGPQYALSEAEKLEVYRYVSGDFVSAALMPQLFKSNQMHLPVRQVLGAYRDSYFSLERAARDLAGVTWSRSALVRYDLRELYAADGFLFRADGEKGSARNPVKSIVGDYIETVRRLRIGHQRKGGLRWWLATHEGVPSAVRGREAAGSADLPLTLESIYASGPDKAEGLPAIVFRRLNEHEFEQKLKPLTSNPERSLRDPATGGWREMGGTGDWKDSAMIDDWKKLRGMLQRDEPTGIWKALDQVRRGANTLAMSVLMGDLSVLGIQLPFLVALNPGAGAKAMGKMFGLGGNIWSDAKFSAWTAANMDMIEMAVSRGMGLGLEAFVGARFRSGSMWEHLPLTRPFGKAMKYVNDIHFNRFMTVLKTEALKTQLDVVHSLRMVGPAIAAPYINEMPGLRNLNKEVDLMGATPMEVFDGVIRTINNQFGGIPRSQSQIGLWRDFTEHMLLIVPGFFRARAGLINQMSRAATKPTSVEGWLAMNVIAKELAYTNVLGAGIASMNGNLDLWLEQRKDPRRAEFWGVPVGDAAAGEFLKLAPSPAAMQLYIRMVGGMGDIKDPKERAEVIKRWATGRENPALSLVLDQYNGRDFFGNERKSVKDRAIGGALGVVPIWMGELGQGIEDQVYQPGDFDYKAVATDTAAEFLGFSHRAPQPYEQLNNKFRAWQARTSPNREPLDWEYATSELKEIARNEEPSLVQAENVWAADRARKESDKSRYANVVFNQFDLQQKEFDEQQAEDTQLALAGRLPFDKWIERHSDIGKVRSQAAEDLRATLMDIGIDLEESSKRKLEAMQIQGRGPLVALALAEYQSVEPGMRNRRVVLGDGTVTSVPELDFESFDRARQAVLARYPKSVQEQVEEITGPKDEMEIKYRDSQKDLDAYFEDIPKYNSLSVDEGNFVDFLISTLRSVEKRVQQEGLDYDRKRLYLQVLGGLAKQGKIGNRTQIGLASKAYAWALDGNERLKSRTPQNLRFLIDHPDLVRFFPWFRGEIPTRMWRYMPADTRAPVDVEGLQEREMRGTPLSAVGG